VALGLGGPGKRRLPARSRIGFRRHPLGRFGANGTGLAGLRILKKSTRPPAAWLIRARSRRSGSNRESRLSPRGRWRERLVFRSFSPQAYADLTARTGGSARSWARPTAISLAWRGMFRDAIRQRRPLMVPLQPRQVRVDARQISGESSQSPHVRMPPGGGHGVQ